MYCLRSNEITWDEEARWRTRAMLIDPKSGFRSLKGELRLILTSIRNWIAATFTGSSPRSPTGILEPWSSLRSALSNPVRATASMRCKDGRKAPVRIYAEVGGAIQLIS